MCHYSTTRHLRCRHLTVHRLMLYKLSPCRNLHPVTGICLSTSSQYTFSTSDTFCVNCTLLSAVQQREKEKEEKRSEAEEKEFLRMINMGPPLEIPKKPKKVKKRKKKHGGGEGRKREKDEEGDNIKESKYMKINEELEKMEKMAREEMEKWCEEQNLKRRRIKGRSGNFKKDGEVNVNEAKITEVNGEKKLTLEEWRKKQKRKRRTLEDDAGNVKKDGDGVAWVAEAVGLLKVDTENVKKGGEIGKAVLADMETQVEKKVDEEVDKQGKKVKLKKLEKTPKKVDKKQPIQQHKVNKPAPTTPVKKKQPGEHHPGEWEQAVGAYIAKMKRKGTYYGDD